MAFFMPGNRFHEKHETLKRFFFLKHKKGTENMGLVPFSVPWYCNCLQISTVCGERGIRTPGTSRFNGFQDRRDRPLCHLS
jgi:hypothetical protein